MDLNADRNAVLDELHTRFSDGCIDFTQNYENEDFRESLAMCDESIMNTFLADMAYCQKSRYKKCRCTKKNIPVLFRLALKRKVYRNFLKDLNCTPDKLFTMTNSVQRYSKLPKMSKAHVLLI